MLPGSSSGIRNCSTQAAKLAPLIGPSITQGATMPSCLSPAMKVSVFQWPCGTLARSGLPRSPHAALERAQASARAAGRRFPKSPWIAFELARLALADRDPVVKAEGRRALERCLLLGERPFAPAHMRLGQLCEADGDTLGAFHHYLQVFEEPEGLAEDVPVLARLRRLGTP